MSAKSALSISKYSSFSAIHLTGTHLSLDAFLPNIKDWHEKNGNRTFCTSKHTLKQTLLNKSQLKCSSNIVATLQ